MIANIRYILGRFFGQRAILIQLLVIGCLQLFMWLYLIQNRTIFSENTFLHYTVGVGVDFVGPSRYAFSAPLIGITLLLTNVACAFSLYSRQKIISYFFVSLTTLWHVFLTIAIVLLVAING